MCRRSPLWPACPLASCAGGRGMNSRSPSRMGSRSTILVTGGAGCIGSELVRQLAAAGERVLIVDNLVNGTRANVEEVLSDRVTLLVTDIRALDRFKRELGSVRTVYHLACLGVRHSVHSPIESHDVNATATLRLVAACRDAD